MRQLPEWLEDKASVQVIFEKDNTLERLHFASERYVKLSRYLSQQNYDGFVARLTGEWSSIRNVLRVKFTFIVNDINTEKFFDLASSIESEGFHIFEKTPLAYKLTEKQEIHLANLVEDVKKNVMINLFSFLGISNENTNQYIVDEIRYHNEDIQLQFFLRFHDMRRFELHRIFSRKPEISISLPYLGYKVDLHVPNCLVSNICKRAEVVDIVQKYLDRLIVLDTNSAKSGYPDIENFQQSPEPY